MTISWNPFLINIKNVKNIDKIILRKLIRILINKYITDKKIMQKKALKHLISNKQNNNSHSPQSLNYKISRTGLVQRDPNTNQSDERIKTLLNQNNQLRKQSQQQYEKYKVQLTNMLKRTTKLEQTVIQLENVKIEYEEEIQFLGKKVKDLGEKLAVFSQFGDVKDIQKRKGELQRQCIVLKQQLSIKQAENCSLKAQLQQQKRNLKTQQQTHRKQLQSFQHNSQQYNSLKKQQQQYKTKILELTKQLSFQKSKLSQLNQSKSHMNLNEIRKMQEKYLIEKQEIKNKYEQEIMRLESVHAFHEKQIYRLKENFEEKCGEIREYEKKIGEYEKKIGEVQVKSNMRLSEYNKMKIELEASTKQRTRGLQQSVYRNRTLQSTIEQLKSTLKSKEEHISDIEKSMKKWQDQYKKAAQSRDQIEAQFVKSKGEILKLKEEKQWMQKQMENIGKEREQDAGKDKKIQELNNLKSQLQLKLFSIQAGSTQKKTKIENLQKQLQIQTKNSLQLQSRLETQTQTTQSLQSQIRQLSSSLKSQQQALQQTVQQLQQIKHKFQQSTILEQNKQSQLQQLIQKLRQKLVIISQQKQQVCKIKEKRIRELEEERERAIEVVNKFKDNIAKLEDQIAKGKRQVWEVRHEGGERVKEFQRMVRLLQEEKGYLEQEIDKWKNIKKQISQQLQDTKRQNRRLKPFVQQYQQLTHKITTIQQKNASLEQSVHTLSQQLSMTNHSHSLKVQQLKKHYQQKLQLSLQENRLYQQKIKAKIESDLSTQHRDQIIRIRRKSEDCNIIVNRYEKKIQDLEIFSKEVEKKAKIESEALIKQIEKREREIQGWIDKYEESKKKTNIFRQQMQDLSKKYREKQQNYQEVFTKLKKSQVLISSLNQQLSISSSALADFATKIKSLEQKNVYHVSQLQKYQNNNMKNSYEMQQLQKKVSELEKAKANYEQKLQKAKVNYQQNLKNVQKRLQKIEEQKKMLQKDKTSLEGLVKIQRRKWEDLHAQSRRSKSQYEVQYERRRNQQISDLKYKNQKCETELILLKQKTQTMEKTRRQLYLKLCSLSTPHFNLQPSLLENQSQFLLTLFHKLNSILLQYQTLQTNRTQLQQSLSMNTQQYIQNYNKSYDENLNIKENYNILYKKYLKYKEAFIHCKTKLERCRIQVVNDHRFTQQILTHCKTLLPKLE